MKKIILSVIVLLNLSYAGQIKEIYSEINKIENQNDRIEKKLDLIILKMVQDEKKQEDSVMSKSKSSIESGTSWLKEKMYSFGKQEEKKEVE